MGSTIRLDTLLTGDTNTMQWMRSLSVEGIVCYQSFERTVIFFHCAFSPKGGICCTIKGKYSSLS